MVRTWDWGKLTFVVTMHEDLSLPIERLGGGKFNAMKFAKPILSPRNMIRIIEGVMESGRGRGHGHERSFSHGKFERLFLYRILAHNFNYATHI